jgi:hypothetical protein
MVLGDGEICSTSNTTVSHLLRSSAVDITASTDTMEPHNSLFYSEFHISNSARRWGASWGGWMGKWR